jgi:pyruvyltransferase
MSPRQLKPELLGNPAVWIRLGLRTGRPLMNFGDELTRYVLQYATGRKVLWSPPTRADVVAIGSILELYMRRPGHAVIWGTGLRAEIPENLKDEYRSHAGSVLAVRGPATRRELGLSDDIPMGDAGLLAAALIDRTMVKRTSGTVLIPHFRAWSTTEGRREITEARNAGIDVVPPTTHPLAVIKRVAGARFVLSSSLHGVIVAHSVGTPSQLLTVSDAGVEPQFKYGDYYASMGLTPDGVTLQTAMRGLDSLFERREAEAGPAEQRASELSESLVSAISAI